MKLHKIRRAFQLGIGVFFVFNSCGLLAAGNNNDSINIFELIWENPCKQVQKLLFINTVDMESPLIGATGDDQSIVLLSLDGAVSGTINLPQKPTLVQIGYVLDNGAVQIINSNPLSNQLDIYNIEGKPVGKHISQGRIQEYIFGDFNDNGESEILLGIRTSPGLYLFKYPDHILWQKENVVDVKRIETVIQNGKTRFLVLSNKGYIESFDYNSEFLDQYFAPVYLDDFHTIFDNSQFRGLVAIGNHSEKQKSVLYYFDSRGLIRWEKTLPFLTDQNNHILEVGDVTGKFEDSIIVALNNKEILILNQKGFADGYHSADGFIKDFILIDLNRDGQKDLVLAVAGKGVEALKYVDRVKHRKKPSMINNLNVPVHLNSPTVFWTATNYLELGNKLFSRDKLDTALDAFQKAVILNPELAISYANVAIALIGMEKMDDAEVFCKKSMDLDPYLPDASAYLGIIEYEKGNLDRAISLNLKADSLSSSKRYNSSYSLMDKGSIYYNLACAYARQSKPKLALSNLEKAFGLNPSLQENAFNDNDLKILRQYPEFKKLIETH
ncbi:MAG: hypothetical protein A2161_10180 [Candidatus Schekmanbacteria bacterium RBG_13_48_7]|uniref:RING-type E3 ubiquitin transferase n=1 Tax=Candidatus Schekmanbacteria bacterium RBG_13_48_7 TaxID=1817878 RepID=A0A1F7S0Q7_9BACT|nr:MAG: hypothetical protein A2161_10180 [Candidatus Schekmanbacteria bacterium RBG_13_48_7]